FGPVSHVTRLPPANGGSLNCTSQMMPLPTLSHIVSARGGGFRVDGSTGSLAKACDVKAKMATNPMRNRASCLLFILILLVLRHRVGEKLVLLPESSVPACSC